MTRERKEIGRNQREGRGRGAGTTFGNFHDCWNRSDLIDALREGEQLKEQ